MSRLSGEWGARIQRGHDGNGLQGRGHEQRRLRGRFRTLLLAAAALLLAGQGAAQDPNITETVPAESFLGEQFCFTTEFTNDGATGFGPYLQLVLPPELILDSAQVYGAALGGGLQFIGTFPVDPDPGVTETELTDPRINQPVLGPEGFSLYLLVLPVGSLVDGAPPLPVDICLTIDPDAVVGEPLPISLTPVYQFGDTATGANGPIIGDLVEQEVVPTVLLFEKTNNAPESERPPGATWPYTYTLTVDIANTATINPITITDELPGDFLYEIGSADIVAGDNCLISQEPDGLSPGGTLIVTCGENVGTTGGGDIVITYSGHIVDILDETTCATSPVLNDASVEATYVDQGGTPIPLPPVFDDSLVTAKHVALQKSASPGQLIPGNTVTYTLAGQVTDFGDVSELVITDVLSDGLEFIGTSVTVNIGGTPVTVAPDVTINPNGTTTIVLEISDAYFAQTPATQIDASTALSISYQAVVLQEYRETNAPVLAADSLPNSVIADYDMVQGALACEEDSSASIGIVPVEVIKSIVDPQPFYEPGDLVQFRLRLDVPSGDTRDIIFTDFLPLPVLQVGDVDLTFSLDLNDCPASAGICRGPNDTLGLVPDSITADPALNAIQIEWQDIDTTSGQIIEVDLYTVVTDDPFPDGLFLTNIFQAQTSNTPGDVAVGTGPVQIQVGAPDLVMTKGVLATDGDGVIDPPPSSLPVNGNISGVEASDEITFQLTIENIGASPAFEVTILDDPPAGLIGCTLDTVVNGDGIVLATTGDLFDINDPLVLTDPLPGRTDPTGPPFGAETALVTFTCTVDQSVQPEQLLTNFATGAYTSQPGGPQFPGIEDEADIGVASVETEKSLVATSEAHTSDTASPPRVAIGEIVRYRLATRIPQGTMPNLQIEDLLPAGLRFFDDDTATLAFVSASGGNVSSSTLSGAGLNVAGTSPNVTPTFVIPGSAISPASFGSGTNPVFSLGTVVNEENNDTPEWVVIEFNALVLNAGSAGNNRNNRFRVLMDGEQIGPQSNQVQVRLVEPAINIVKNADPTSGQAGTLVDYTVTLSVLTGENRADAFDVLLTDTLPALAQLVPGSVSVATNAACSSPGITDNTAGNTVELLFDQLPTGCVVTVDYQATLTIDVIPGTTVNNTANLAWTSLPGTGTDPNPTDSVTPGDSGDPDGERTYSGSNGAQVTIDSVAPAKSIVTTSEAHTSGNNLAIGELVTYRLAVQLPQGTSPDFAVIDQLDPGLAFQAGSARLAFVANDGGISSSDPAIGTGPQITGDSPAVSPTFVIPAANIIATGDPQTESTTVRFELGTLTNADDDADAEFVVIEFDALLLNIAGNVAGVTRNNSFTVEIGGTQNGPVSNTQPVVVVEPSLVGLDKSADPDSGDAGDLIDFSVEFNVASGANNVAAFDVILADTLPAQMALDLTSISVTATACGPLPVEDDQSSGNSVLLEFAVLPPGCQIEVNYTAELLVAVTPGQVLTNTANLTWTSLPGAGTDTPGAPGDVDGERTGDGGVNSYFDSDDADVTIDAVTLAKTVVDTSNPFTGDDEVRPGVDDLAIGETATFHITATIPEGTTPEVIITDTVPYTNGVMEVVSAQVISVGSNLSPENDPPIITISDNQLGDGIDDTVVFNFGEVINPPGGPGGAASQITVEVVALVLDLPANTSGDQLTNTALVQFGPGLSGSASAGVDIVEPFLNLTKTGDITQGDAGDLVTFTLELRHTSASTADAHDVSIVDNLPAGLVLVAGSLQSISGPAPTSLTEPGNGIEVVWDVFERGEVAEIQFQATLAIGVQPAEVVTNTSQAAWSSMPGLPPEQRVYGDSDGHSITITEPGVVKTIINTSNPDTGSDQFGPEVDLTIGESVTYQITVTFPEGTSEEVVVRDQLPTGSSILELVSAELVFIGANLSGAGLSLGDPGVASDSNSDGFDDRVQWNLGTIVNDPDGVVDEDDTLVFEVVAVVVDQPVNQSGVVEQVNTATLNTATVGPISGTVAIDIVAPRLLIDKAVTDPADGFVEADQLVTNTLTIRHATSSPASTAPAYNVTITDTLPQPGVSWEDDATVVSDCPGLNVNSGAAPVIEFSFDQFNLDDGPADNGVCTISYQVRTDLTVQPNQSFTNTASMAYDSMPVFVAGQTRRLTDADSAEITVIAPALVKVSLLTSLDDTGSSQHDPALFDLAIGEEITYQITLILPEGLTVDAVVTDTMPLDGATTLLEAVGANVVSTGGNISTTLPGTPVFSDVSGDGVNDTVTFNFGDITNTPDGVSDENDRIVLNVVGRVRDVPSNVDSDVLVNLAEFDFATGNLSDTADAEIVEPDLALSKSMGPIVNGAVQVTLTVTNTGTAPAYDISVSDVLDESVWDVSALSTVSVSTGFSLNVVPGPGAGEQTVLFETNPGATPPGFIPVGNAVTAVFTVPLAQLPPVPNPVVNLADLDDACSLPGGCAPGGNGRTQPPDQDDAQIGIPDLVLEKTAALEVDADGSGDVSPGDTLRYTLVLTNIGAATATGVVITDAPDALTTLVNGSVTTTQGSIVTGNNPGDATIEVDIGSVTASGSVTITYDVVLANPFPAGVTEVVNQALVNSTELPPGVSDDPDTPTPDDETVVPVNAEPDLTIVKSDGGTTTTAGGTIIYVLQYENVGNQDATGVFITDTVPDHTSFDPTNSSAGWSCVPDNSAGSLCTITIGDLDAGDGGSFNFAVIVDNPLPAGVDQIDNLATISDDGANSDEPITDTDDESTPVVAEPALFITKSDGGVTAVPGDVVVYTLNYGNNGDQDATGVFITDTVPDHTSFNPAASTTGWSCVPDNSAGSLCTISIGDLDVGDTGSVTFAVTVDNPVPAGVDQIDNLATISDDGANSDDPITDSDDEVTPVIAQPALSINKDDGGVTAEPGDVVVYTLTFANTGNQDATGVFITDTVPDHTSFDPASSSAGWSCVPDSSAGSVCTILIGDLDAGDGGSVSFAVTVDNPLPTGVTEIFNIATISDDGANSDEPITDSDGDNTPVDAQPELFITKDDGGVTVEPGDVVVYTLSYGNTGNQDATGVFITDTVPDHTSFDPAASSAGWSCMPDNSAGSLCTITIGDLDAGDGGSVNFAVIVDNPLPAGVDQIDNLATISDDGANSDEPITDSDDESTPVDAVPDLTITKSDQGVTAEPGSTVIYLLSYENVGNQDATGVVITETVPDNTSFAAGDSSPGWVCVPDGNAGSTCTLEIGPLAAGSGVQTALFAVTVDDPLPLDVEELVNLVSIADDGENGDDPTPDNNSDNETTPVEIDPAMELTKQLVEPVPDPILAGSILLFEVTATNTGNMTLTNVVVSDDLITPDEITCFSVAPGDTCVLSGQYVVTQDDMNDGQVVNNATANSDQTDEEDADLTVPIEQDPAIELTKAADTEGPVAAGEEIGYTITVTNTGNVTLFDVDVDDSLIPIDCVPATPVDLDPQEQIICTGSYEVTQDDIDLGEAIVNVATASGTDPNDEIVDDDDGTETPVEDADPAIELVKEANLIDQNNNGFADPGETIEYTLTATNTGNVTLTDVIVIDSLISIDCVPAIPAVLAPGEQVICTGEYEVTVADIGSQIINFATVSGQAPDSQIVDDADQTATTAIAPINVPVGGPAGWIVLMLMLMLMAGRQLASRRSH